MKKFLELGNRYAAQSDWKDFALTKFCLFAMGIIVGVNVPKKNKDLVEGFSGGVFITTYVILMAKVFSIIKEMMCETPEKNED